MIIPLTFYILSFGLMILNKGIYWDDWTFYGLPLDKHATIFNQYGAPWRTYIDILILSLPQSQQIFHILTFLSYFLSTIFLYKLLQPMKSINSHSKIIISTLFSIFPVNILRVTFVTFSYTLSYLFFFFAFWLISVNFKKNKVILRIISLIAFFASFTTFSLLPFYTIVIAYLYYQDGVRTNSKRKITHFIFHRLDFISIPILFWVMRSLFFKPYGLYGGYNQISVSSLLPAAFQSLSAFKVVLFDLIGRSIHSMNFITLLIGGFLLYKILKRILHLYIPSYKNNLTHLFLGAFIFFLGSYSYYASGHILSNDFWDNRHELLTPFGASVLLFFGLQAFFLWQKINRNLQLYIFSIIFLLFTNYNFVMNAQYFKDWYKQKSIMYHMKNQPEFSSATTFIFKDNTKDLNVLNRLYAFYEYTGILKFVFQDEKRFALDFDSYIDRQSAIPAKKEDINSYYSTSQYIPKKPDYIIDINRGDYVLGWQNLFRLIFSENFNKDSFNETIPHIVTFSIKKFND